MPSSFPGAVDVYTTKVPHVNPNAAADINALQDAVIAIETELKTSSVGTPLDYVSKSRPDTITGVKTFSQPVSFAQSAELALVPIYSVAPFTVGNAPFQAQGNSFANAGAGAGTYNHAAFIGWNAARHSQGTPTAGKPAILMGFEDNFYDNGGTNKYGVEWYVEYWSPDGSSVTQMRPFYARVEGSNLNTSNNATIHMDIGTDGTGLLGVFAGLLSPSIFTITPTLVQTNQNFQVTGLAITISPPAASAFLYLNRTAGGGPGVQYQYAGNAVWQHYASSSTVWTLYDNNNGRAHATFTQGATPTTATTELNSKLKIDGLPAFAASDKYLVVDASGNVHVSALGPAS